MIESFESLSPFYITGSICTLVTLGVLYNIYKNEDSSEKKCNSCQKDAKFFCSLCNNSFYCSRNCQLNDWAEHSKICKKNM